MFRGDTRLPGTTVAMGPLGSHHRWFWAHGDSLPGCGATGVFANENPKLQRHSKGFCGQPCLLPNPNNGLPVEMSLAFQLRNHKKLHRCSSNSVFYGGEDKDTIDKISRQVQETIADTLLEVGNAIGPKKSDMLFLKKRGAIVEVPSGSLVTERTWAKLNTNRKVSFNPRIAVVLVPTKDECYPTAIDTAACFFSDEERGQQAKDVSTGGRGNAEWLALLAETRQKAAEDRERDIQARLRSRQKQEQHQAQEGGKRAFNLFDTLGRFWHSIFTTTTNDNDNGDFDDNGRRSEGHRRDEGVSQQRGADRNGAAEGSSRKVTREHPDPTSCSSVVNNETKGQEAG